MRALLIASWIVWPVAVALLNVWLAPGPHCAAGADCPMVVSWWRAALWIAAALVPGTIVTAMWRRRRTRA